MPGRNVDTEQAGEKLVNQRLAYVAVSRARYDAQIYTNDKAHLTEQLGRDVSQRTAIEADRTRPVATKIAQSAPSQTQTIAAHGQCIE